MSKPQSVHGLSLLVALTFFQPVVAGEPQYTLPGNPYTLDEDRCCGPHCVCFLDGFFSGECNIEEVMADCTPGPLGTSLDQLELACQNLGYFTAAIKGADVETLLSVQFPVIVHLSKGNRSGHFMVVLGYNEQNQTIRGFSPPRNYGSFDPELLRDQMTGLGLVVSDKPLPPFDELVGQKSSLSLWLGSPFVSAAIVVGFILYQIRGRRVRTGAPAVLTKSLCVVVLLLIPAGCTSGDRDVEVRDPYRVHLGKVQEGIPVIHRFQLINTSDKPIRVVRVEKSCSCQEVTVDKNADIAPGASREVLVSFSTKGLDGEVRQEVTVFTNSDDPRLSTVLMTISGIIDAGIKVIPSHIMLGNFAGNDPIERQLQLRITDPKYVDLEAAIEVDNNPYVTVQMLQHTRGLTTYKVVIDPRIPAGAIYGDISFKFDPPDVEDIVVSLAGTRLGDLKIIPRVLAIPRDAAFPIIRTVRLRSVSGAPFHITNVDASKGTSISEIPRIGSGPQLTFDIDLEILKHDGLDQNSFVTITTETDTNVQSKVAILLVFDRAVQKQ